MVLADIRTLKLSYPYDDVMVAGDFNCDLSRNTPMVNFVNSHMVNNSMSSLWQHYSVDYTYQSASMLNSKSTLDHFYVSNSFVASCQDAGVVHNVHNTSDHSVIYVKFRCNTNVRHTTEVKHIPRASWSRASQYNLLNYHNDLRHSLNGICIPHNVLSCSDVMCNDHDMEIDKYCNNIIECMLHSQSKHIPSTAQRLNRKPGWNMYVGEHYKEPMYWHIQWITQGRPGNGYYNIMRNRSRSEYNKSVRYINKNRDLIKRVNFLNATVDGDTNLFTEIRKIK